jgi:hypothetical protein
LKRALLTTITLYLLYDRQKRVEARTQAWQRRLEGVLQRWAESARAEYCRFTSEVVDADTRVRKEVNEAFKSIAGGKR